MEIGDTQSRASSSRAGHESSRELLSQTAVEAQHKQIREQRLSAFANLK